MKKLQIGIMGSAKDLNYSDEALIFAKELGKEIAKSGNILVYGAEKEYTSLSTNALLKQINMVVLLLVLLRERKKRYMVNLCQLF